MEYTATQKLDRLERALREYPVQKMQAAVRALNRTATAVRAETARRLKPDLGGIKIGALKRQMKLANATKNNPRAILDYSAKRFRVFGNVDLRQIATKWGLGARLSKMPFKLELADGTPITSAQLQRMFIQRSRRTGRANVWVRLGLRSRPFQAVVVASVAEAYRVRTLGPAMLALGRERMAIVLEQEFKYRLSQRS